MSNGFRESQTSQTKMVESPSASLLDDVIRVTAASRHSFDDIHRMAIAAGKSAMFKMNSDQIEVLMLLCQAEGIEPIKALAMYDVFNGKPAMKSLYMLARHQASGGTFKWIETTDAAAECFFSHRTACPEGITIRWTIEDAKRAGLTGKDNWKGYAEDMLVWRVVARGVRRSNPACLFGLDVPEAQEVEPPTSEAQSRTALIDKLAARRESPRESHQPVSETVAELRDAPKPVPPIIVDRPEPAEAPPRDPSTEWGKMIADALVGANEALEKLAVENPGNMELRKPLRAQQVARGILAVYIERGDIDEASLKNEKGKRDPAREASALSFLWTDDQEELEAQVAKYIGSKLTAILDSLKPSEAPAQGELVMS